MRDDRKEIEQSYAALNNAERKVEAERILREESFKTPDGRLMLYSGTSKAVAEDPKSLKIPHQNDARGNNYQRAKLMSQFDHAANPDKDDAWHMIDQTPGGRRLNALYPTRGDTPSDVAMNLKQDYGITKKDYDGLWDRASERVVREQPSQARAFVDGARDQSTYARIEAPTASKHGVAINGVSNAPSKTLEERRKTLQETKDKDVALRKSARRGKSAKTPQNKER